MGGRGIWHCDFCQPPFVAVPERWPGHRGAGIFRDGPARGGTGNFRPSISPSTGGQCALCAGEDSAVVRAPVAFEGAPVYRARVTTLLVATRNTHKAGEIRAILGGQFRLFTLNEFSTAPAVVENAATFAGNATKKAVELAKWLSAESINHQPSTINFVLADDSGLEVDALGGAPGVHSARFAALDSAKSGNAPDADNNAKLLRLLQEVPPEKRTAHFYCVMALVEINPQSTIRNPQLFDGVCEGRILFTPRGQNGFGYDPLFVPVGFEQTFAELGEDVKNQLSHRAQALAKLKRGLDAAAAGRREG
jgi:XTP/dITP diphosphohydrolase